MICFGYNTAGGRWEITDGETIQDQRDWVSTL